jgi:hypothetical protein
MVKIYKLIYKGDIVYVGQTTQRLERRKAAGYGNTLPFFKECLIELIEETNDVSRERYWIERLRSEGHTLLNKEAGDGFDRVKYQREYRDCNKEKIIEKNIEYREKNKEKIKEYYQNNKEKIKEYYQKDEVQVRKKKYMKEYFEKNKEKKREYDREYKKNKKSI